MNRQLGRLRAIGAVFGFQWLYSEAASQQEAAQLIPESPDDLPVDPDGYTWMVGTHKAEPTAKEMKEKMLEMMRQQPASTATAA